MWNTIIYNPIFNLLVWLYDTIPGKDIGVAIIVLTLIIKFILYPLTQKSLASQKALQDIQPKIKEVQEKYKDQKEVQAKELMKLYKEEKVSPFSSCLPILIQLPILIAMYQVFRDGLMSTGFDKLYPFVANPGTIHTVSMGFMDLANPSIPLAVVTGIAQFVQSKMMMTSNPPKVNGAEIAGSKDEKMMANVNKQMLYMMPVMTVIFGLKLPAGLTLYWLISTLFMVAQQSWLFHQHAKKAAAKAAVQI